MRTCLFVFYNYQIDEQTIENRLIELKKISKEVGAKLEHLRYNLPDKFVPIEKIIEYALPQLLFGKGYDRVVALNMKKIPSVEEIKSVMDKINDNDPVIGDNCMGFCKELYVKERR